MVLAKSNKSSEKLYIMFLATVVCATGLITRGCENVLNQTLALCCDMKIRGRPRRTFTERGRKWSNADRGGNKGPYVCLQPSTFLKFQYVLWMLSMGDA